MAKHKFPSISLTVRDRAISSKFSTHRVSKDFASISLTVQDRAISSKFSTHRVSKECTLCDLPKMAKHKFASISLTVRDRAISSKFSTHRVSKECNLCNFQKKIPLPQNGGHFEFSNICQKWQNTNLLLSP